MAHLTDERVSHLAHLIQDCLLEDGLVICDDEAIVLREIKTALNQYLKVDEEIDSLVRVKISSQRKGIQEASPEWDILYKKYFEEELSKRRL